MYGYIFNFTMGVDQITHLDSNDIRCDIERMIFVCFNSEKIKRIPHLGSKDRRAL